MSRQADTRGAEGDARRGSERFAYATLDALSEHVAVLDERGNVVAVNSAWRRFARANSLSPEGLSEGANYFSACASAAGEGAEGAARFADGLRAVIGGELDEFSLEYPCHSPTQQRWFIARATRFELDGEVRAVVNHANITTRKLAEEATRFRSHLLNTVEQAVIATDLSGTIIYWNRFAEKLYGWPADEIIGRNIMEVILPQGAQEQASEVMSRLQAGESWSGEFTVRRCDGTTFRAFITDAPIYDAEGKVVGIVGVSSDITKRKLAEEELRRKEARFRVLFELGPVAVFACDRSAVIQDYNRRAAELWGREPKRGDPNERFCGSFKLYHPDGRLLPHEESPIAEVLRTGVNVQGVEVFIERPDSSRIPVIVNFSSLKDEQGEVVGAITSFLDISERKEVEERLRESEERHRAIVSQAMAGVTHADLSGKFTIVNQKFCDITGYSESELLGMRMQDITHPDDLPLNVELFGRMVAEGTPFEIEKRYIRKDGSIIWVNVGVSVIRDREGKTQSTVAVVLDITGRKRAEQRLTQSEEQLRAIFEASRDGILVEHDERIVYVNNSYARLFGYEQPEELIGEHISVVTSPDDGEQMLTFGRRRLRGEPAPTAYEFRGRRKDRALIALEASVSTHTVAGKTYITTAVRDIAERKLADEALRQSERKYRVLLDQASDGIHTYDLRGNFIETNPKLCEMLGYTREELLRLNVKDIIPPEDLAAAPIRFDELQAGQTLLTERRLRRKDGTLLPVEISGRMIQDGVLQSIIRDISERRRAEEELHKAYDELERRVEERTAELARANVTLKEENAERLRAEEARRELLRRLVTAQEEERRRISRELHDQMGQQLTALMMGLKTLDADSHGRQSALHTLRQLQEMTDQLSQEVHTLAWGLRPPALDDLGVHTAIYNYVEEWAERSRVPVDFHSAGFEGGRLPFSHETALYRIAQEALTNVFKHSGADRVSFILERRGDHVLAVIEDNGEGFDVEAQIGLSVEGRKLGLLGMRERATLLGGTLNIESALGAGTSVFVRIPVEVGGEERGSPA